jgi:lipopolysaccharide/colanic/teichoic acid biosynthesis glycosyltransferase
MTDVAGRVPDSAGLELRQDWSKRTLDVTICLISLIVVAPLLALLCCLVSWTSPGPALFRQERLGLDKRPFTMLKLRTMTAVNDDQVHRDYVTRLLCDDRPPAGGRHGLFKLEGDPRVTPLGKWLRRTSLDELPQLLNVLRGEMSLVGPRPVLPWEAELFPAQYEPRFTVKPGITGLWQVRGRSRLPMRDGLELDVEYARTHSLALDVAILIGTLPALLRGNAR